MTFDNHSLFAPFSTSAHELRLLYAEEGQGDILGEKNPCLSIRANGLPETYLMWSMSETRAKVAEKYRDFLRFWG
jgi:hypothetical protein